MPQNTAAKLWLYNSNLLEQAITMIERLKVEATASFDYAQAVGPHVRHIVEHYTALLDALQTVDGMVDYDARNRDMRLQSIPDVTLAKLRELRTTMQTFATSHGQTCNPSKTLRTRLQVGTMGELTVSLDTTLGRELAFLSSHTVHHFALLGQYSKAAGVDLGNDFGKAPATMAYELQAA